MCSNLCISKASVITQTLTTQREDISALKCSIKETERLFKRLKKLNVVIRLAEENVTNCLERCVRTCVHNYSPVTQAAFSALNLTLRFPPGLQKQEINSGVNDIHSVRRHLIHRLHTHAYTHTHSLWVCVCVPPAESRSSRGDAKSLCSAPLSITAHRLH